MVLHTTYVDVFALYKLQIIIVNVTIYTLGNLKWNNYYYINHNIRLIKVKIIKFLQLNIISKKMTLAWMMYVKYSNVRKHH